MRVGKIIELTNVAYADLLHDVSLKWKQGEHLALMGANGSGKSTLAKLIAGHKAVSGGSIALREPFEEQSNSSPQVGALAQAVTIIGAHPRRQIIGASVAEELAFALVNKGYPPQAVQDKVTETLAALGLQGKENQSPHTLSGGERQRLVAAAVLAAGYPFIIFDEALSMLDVQAQRRMYHYVLKHAQNAGLLWITHDPELALKQQRLLVIHNGQLLEVPDPEKALHDKHFCCRLGIAPLGGQFNISGQFELSFETIPPPDRKPVPYDSTPNNFSLENSTEKELFRTEEIEKVQFYTEESSKQQAIQGQPEQKKQPEPIKHSEPINQFDPIKQSELIKLSGPIKHPETNIKRPEPQTRWTDPLISWKEASFSPNLCLTGCIYRGEVIAVLGRSGSGKTTLLESVVGWRKPSSGSLEVHAVESIGFLLQEAGEYLIEGLERVSPEKLSGGERQLLALRSVLEKNPPLLLLDEPLLGLDSLHKSQMLAELVRLKRESAPAMIYVTHDLAEVLPLADRIWLLDNGRIELDCPIEDWLDHRAALERAGVKVPGCVVFDEAGKAKENAAGKAKENTACKTEENTAGKSNTACIAEENAESKTEQNTKAKAKENTDCKVKRNAEANAKANIEANTEEKCELEKGLKTESILNHLDPRLKLLGVMVVSLLIGMAPVSGLIISTLIVGVLFRIGPKLIISWKAMLLPLSVLALFYCFLLGWRGYSGISFWEGSIDWQGLEAAGMLIWRVALVFSLTILLISSTSYVEQGLAINWLLSPVARLKGSGDLALLIMLTLRFIPMLREEFIHLGKARLVKGPMEKGLWGKLREGARLLLPLMRLTLRRAEEVGEHLLARGYNPQNYRSYLRFNWARQDSYALCLLAVWGIILVVVWILV